MTRNKDFKRLVRARMKKTGEAYTSARAQVARTSKSAAAAPTPAPEPIAPKPPKPAEYAALAGTSDATMKAKTGCPWQKWVHSLDHHGAATMTHTEIAKLVHSKYKIDGWWSQAVAVGYERIKGLRARGQQRNGTYHMTKSRTFNVPVADLFDAWKNPSVRKRWLNGAAVKVRTATAPKSMRLDLDGGIVAVGFMAKGAGKSTVALEHTKLPDQAAANRLKEFWTERLAELGAVLKAS